MKNRNSSPGNAAKTRKSDVACLLLIAFLICAEICAAQTPSIRFVDEGGNSVAEVQSKMHNGSLYLPVEVVRNAFDPNLKQQYTSLTQTLVLNLKGQLIHLRIGNPSVTTDDDDAAITLSNPPRIIEGKRMLPLDFFTELLPKLFNVEVFYNAPLQTVHITEKSAHSMNFPTVPLAVELEEFLLVLDPGHGGADTGCQGASGVLEKNVVLDLAKRIRALCLQNRMRIQLTRESDVERRPIERIRIANRNRGQLFLSLHCNASFSPIAAGIRIYINNPMGEFRSEAALPRSNHTSGRGSIKILTQDDYLLQSREFAAVLKDQFAAIFPASPISQSEMPLVTLSGVYMPAILVEIGYLSNTDDADRLDDDEHLASASMAVFLAVQRFSSAFESEKAAVKGN